MMEELDAAAEAARMAESDTGLADPGEWHPTHKSEPGEPLARSGGSRNDEDDDLERDEDDIDDDDDGFERET